MICSSLSGFLLVSFIGHGAPCRFAEVNKFRNATLCVCFATSQLALIHSLLYDGDGKADIIFFRYFRVVDNHTKAGVIFLQLEMLLFAAAYALAKRWNTK